jgi:hypothetical protein
LSRISFLAWVGLVAILTASKEPFSTLPICLLASSL